MIVPDAIRLYIAFAVPGLLAAPLLRRVFPALPGGGVAVARPLGWVLIAWIAWILPSLRIVPYGTPLVVASTLSVAALGAWVGWQDRHAWRDLLGREWKTVLAGELLAAGVYALCVWQIQYNGDIHPLAERFMDYAILKRLEFSRWFPPTDSWMAGKTLVYYYYGYVLMDVLRRLAGMELRWFFNLAIPGVYAAFALALWGCGHALVARARTGDPGGIARRWLAGSLALLGGAFIGNFEFVRQILEGWQKNGKLGFARLDWFRASRVIPGTINETPVFSFVWGDLHPYLIAFPVVALCLCMSIAIVRAEVWPFARSRRVSDRVLTVALLAIPLGALYPTNSWDFPTFVGLAMLALAIPLAPELLDRALAAWREVWDAGSAAWKTFRNPTPGSPPVLGLLGRFSRQTGGTVSRLCRDRTVRAVAGVFVLVAGLSILLYLPFHFGFGNQVGRGVLLAQGRSHAIPMMIHFGPWLLVLLGWAVASSRDRATFVRRVVPLVGTAVLLVLYERIGIGAVEGLVKALVERGGVLAMAGQGVDHLMLRGLAFVLLVSALWVVTDELDLRRLRTPEGVSRGLFAAAFGVVLVCEFAYVNDMYGGESERMNTIFKAYIQAWILLGVASAGLVLAAVDALDRRSFVLKTSLAGAGAAVVVAGLAFPLLADYSRSAKFQFTRSRNLPTWDPLDLFRRTLPADARAVEWIEENLPTEAVLLEADEHAYKWESRIATFTGRLGLIGWKNHESGWRNSWKEAGERGEATATIFTTPDLQKALDLARKYSVEFIYVGELERDRKKYPAFELEKFDALERVYGNERVAIYRVPPSSN